MGKKRPKPVNGSKRTPSKKPDKKVKIGALAWDKDGKPLKSWEDVCKGLNDVFRENEQLPGIAENLRAFHKQEEETPRHLSNEKFQARLVAYAIMRQVPPAFILKNYELTEAQYKIYIVKRFVVSLLQNEESAS